MYPKEFSPVLAVGLVLICVYLLMTGKLTGWAFIGSLAASMFIVVSVHSLDAIQKIAFRGGEVEASIELREVRDQVFAKVDELKKIAAGVAAFTVSSIVNENRFVGAGRTERILRRRDELNRFLKDSGLTDAQILATIEPITRITDWDLRRAIVVNAVAHWRPRKGTDPTDTSERDALQRQVETALQQRDRLRGLEQAEGLLRPLLTPGAEALTGSIEEYRKTLQDGRIPRFGPEDTLTTAPLL